MYLFIKIQKTQLKNKTFQTPFKNLIKHKKFYRTYKDLYYKNLYRHYKTFKGTITLGYYIR